MRAWSLVFLLAAVLPAACGSDGGGNSVADTVPSGDTAAADATTSPDGGDDADTSVEAVPLIGEALPCGTLAEVGGLPAGADLVRVPLDTAAFPDALCNDGSTPQMYVRRYEGEENRGKWLIQLKGGGTCGSARACAQRWCSVLTLFGMTQMVGDIRDPPRAGIGGKGILERRDDNPWGKFNQVFVNYCSSDSWSGTARDAVLATQLPCEPGSACPDGTTCPGTGDDAGVCAASPVQYRIHFLGRRIVDAVFATLRRDGVGALAGGGQELPDLDDADYVVFAGSSGGGAGVTANLDRVAGLLREKNTACQGGGACPLVVEGYIDSIFVPSYEGLDYSATEPCTKGGACSFEAILRLAQEAGPSALWHAEGDESCASWHAARDGEGWRCEEDAHVISHHLTTPFFLRMGLADQLLGPTFMGFGFATADGEPIDTILEFAAVLHPQLEWFSMWADEAEEAAPGARAPGVFAPACAKHETVQSDGAVYETTIDFQGVPRRFFDVWSLWKAGTSPLPVVLVADSPADSTCVDQ